MTRRPDLRTRSRFGVVAILVVLVFGLGGLVWQVVDSTRSRRALVLESNQALAGMASTLIATDVRGRLNSVEGIAARPDFAQHVARQDWSRAETFLQALRGIDPDVASAAVLDSEGRLRARDPQDPSVVGQDFSSRDYFRGALASPGSYLSEVFQQRGTPRALVVAFSVVVRDPGGKVVGLLQATIPITAFDTVSGGVAVPNGGSIQIFDQAGHLLTEAGNDPLKTYADHTLVSQALAGKSGVGEARLPGLSGSRMAAYAPVPEVGWAVLVEQPKSAALRAITELTRRLAGVAGLVMLLALFAALVLIRLIRSLNAERTRTANILASALDPIVSMDDEGRITEFNPAAERVFGYRKEKVVGKFLADTIIPPGLRAKHRSGLARYLETGESKVIGKIIELVGMRADGSEFPVELSINRADDSTGPSFTGVIRDVTERKQAEDELRQSESYKSALFASLAEGVVTTDPSGSVESINPAMERLSGWSEAEVKGRSYWEILPLFNTRGERVSPQDRLLAKAIETQEAVASHGFELTLLTKDGRKVPVAITAAPMVDNRGALIGGVDVIRDISHEREVDQMKSALISTVSHEFRTPLTMIQGFSELLLSREFDRTQSREALKQINSSAVRLGRLIDDLLSVSRIEAGRLAVRKAPVDLGAAITEGTLPLAHRNVRVLVEGGMPRVLADRDMLVQVVTNLVSNAAKYSLPEAPITVAAKSNGSTVEVSVKDEGIGLAPNEITNLFEKFYRVDRPEVREAGGTGLGLFITKNLVEMQGGRIWVKSAPGAGSTFAFSLQIAPNGEKEAGT